MAKVLTAKAVEAAAADPAKRREIADAGLVGLYLVVQPSGVKSWALRYRYGLRPRKLTLGRFPALSLADARDEARKALRALELGQDPNALRVEAKKQAAVSRESRRDTIGTLVGQFDRRHLSGLKSGRQARRFLDRFVVANWGDRSIHEITRRDVLDLLDGIVDAGTSTTANRVLAHARKFFNWAVERDIIDRAPTDGVKAPAKETPRDRVLSDDEIRWLWKATGIVGQPIGPMARLLLLTGQRLGEAAKMSDREIHGDVWRLPAERTKNGRAHDVPLSPAALEVLAGVQRISGDAGLVFTTNGVTGASGFDRAIRSLRASLGAAAADELGRPVEVPPWGFHDLRRTAATGMQRIGTPVHVTEAVLNHVSGTVSGVAAVYQRHDHAAEKRQALERWSRFVMDLTGGRDVEADVVRLAHA